MNQDSTGKFSARRRQLMIAGAALTVVPAGAIAASCGGGIVAASENPFATGSAGQKLVLSGRILGIDCQPLAGAIIEAWHGAAAPVSATTDADGRFVLITAVPAAEGGQPRLSYLVTHPSHDARVHELSFTRASNSNAQGVAQIERDAAGVWRAAFGMTLA